MCKTINRVRIAVVNPILTPITPHPAAPVTPMCTDCRGYNMGQTPYPVHWKRDLAWRKKWHSSVYTFLSEDMSAVYVRYLRYHYLETSLTAVKPFSTFSNTTDIVSSRLMSTPRKALFLCGYTIPLEAIVYNNSVYSVTMLQAIRYRP